MSDLLEQIEDRIGSPYALICTGDKRLFGECKHEIESLRAELAAAGNAFDEIAKYGGFSKSLDWAAIVALRENCRRAAGGGQ